MIETKGLTGAETMLRVLAHMGVERIFAFPRLGVVAGVGSLRQSRESKASRYISARATRKSPSAWPAATPKSTGKLPAVMIHTTVGALHATMGMRGALHEQVPMVVFTGESLGFGEDAGPDVGAQWLGPLADIGGPARLVDRCVKWSYGVNINRCCRRPSSAPANWRWRHPRVRLRVAADGISLRQDDQGRAGDLGFAPGATADAKGIEELANLLAGAKNPVIVTEDSGRTEKSVQKLVEIAELLGARSSRLAARVRSTFRATIRCTAATIRARL